MKRAFLLIAIGIAVLLASCGRAAASPLTDEALAQFEQELEVLRQQLKIPASGISGEEIEFTIGLFNFIEKMIKSVPVKVMIYQIARYEIHHNKIVSRETAGGLFRRAKPAIAII